ncbi:MAG: GNAT family N-acetyltransferase [Prolixibacteraceae bacterium]|jgi:ribosomal protein S18 acetylase RimI-like enzyme|nr:GNAT family N-acetyltransferase [Prolixibacteraceae bacterium]
MSAIIIREIKPSEYSFLEEMLYVSIFIAEGAEKLPRTIIFEPELHKYIKDFGQKNDHCMVAEFNNRLVGACWIRILDESNKGYGFVDAQTPELGMAVLPEFQNKGIGSKLLQAMLHQLKQLKYKQVSLSVDLENFAYKVYTKFGFTNFERTEKSATMLKQL